MNNNTLMVFCFGYSVFTLFYMFLLDNVMHRWETLGIEYSKAWNISAVFTAVSGMLSFIALLVLWLNILALIPIFFLFAFAVIYFMATRRRG